MIKAIIWDFGGVIFPVRPCDENCPPSTFHEIKQAIIDIAELRETAIAKKIYSTFDLWEDLNKYSMLTLKTATRIHQSLTKIDEEILMLLKALETVVSQVALVNEAPYWTKLRLLFYPNLNQLLGEVFDSSETGKEKPHPEAFTQVMKQLMILPEQCLLIDDRRANVLAARQLGMQAVAYEGFESLREYLMNDFGHIIRKYELTQSSRGLR